MSYEFGLKIVAGEQPADVPEGWVALVAPRPLYGRRVVLDPSWGWAGQVVVDPSDEERLRLNASLDASVVAWVDRAEVVAQLRREYIGEYGADVVELVSDDEIWGMFKPPRRITVEVQRPREDA